MINNQNKPVHILSRPEYAKMHAIALIYILQTLIPPSTPHGRLLEPPMRASLWRFDEFKHLDPPVNYDDDAFWCGGLFTQHDSQHKGNCGVCGDDYLTPTPRPHEDGGTYGRGIIARTYTSGQSIPITVELTGAHNGHFTFTLCPRNTRTDPETESCHVKLTLSNNLTSYPATTRKGLYHTTAYLPPHVKCERCVLRWNYKAGNNWGTCDNGTTAVGCGDQETFRGCADIGIK